MSARDKSKGQPRKRNANGLGSLHQSPDGSWHGFVSLGEGEDGKRIRKHIHRKTREETLEAMQALRRESSELQEAERSNAPGTVGDWMTYWLNDIVSTYGKPSTFANYEGAIRRSIVPLIGAVKLSLLTERHIEKLIDGVPTPSGKEMVLKTIKAALAEGWRRRVVKENVAERVKIRKPVAVFSEDEDWEDGPDEEKPAGRRAIPPDDLRAVLNEIRLDRLRARWILGLLGCRRAETLGLIWPDLTDTGMLELKRNRVRRTYRHGCANEVLCGRSPGLCPNRRPVGQVVGLKTTSSARELPLGPGALAILRTHREQQTKERESSPEPWTSKRDWMFTTSDGKPLSHDADYRLWKQLLKRAGVDQSYKPHELRHTAASLMGAKDIDDATLMALMGWSTSRMVNNYRHPFEASMRKALEDFEQDLL